MPFFIIPSFTLSIRAFKFWQAFKTPYRACFNRFHETAICIHYKLTKQFISLVVLPPVVEPLGLVKELVGTTVIKSIDIPRVLAAT